MTPSILAITGAAGFLGRHVCAALSGAGHETRALVRQPAGLVGVREFLYSGLEDRPGMVAAFEGADAVVHLAARVHMMKDRSRDRLAAFRSVNVDGTRTVAELAAAAGVGELIFASSVKAVGESNTSPWTLDTPPAPADAYGLSKLEAERTLAEIGRATGLRTLALRLPTVYGAGMKGNLLRLFRIVDRGWPLPLGNIHNRRSLVFAKNVAAVINRMLGGLSEHEILFLSDGHDVSTPELVTYIAEALGRPARMIPAPLPLLNAAHRLGMPGAAAVKHRLVDSLTVDPAPLFRRLREPLPYTLQAGLAETAAWFRSTAAG